MPTGQKCEAPESDEIFYGPCLGEFGHEIIGAGHVRWTARQGHRITVCSRPDRRAIYADFAASFVPHDFECNGVCQHASPDTAPSMGQLRALFPRGMSVMSPVNVYGSGSARRVGKEAIFIRYGKPQKAYAGCVVIHARSRPHVPARNWPVENWHRLARKLFDGGRVKRIVCIGTRDHAMLAEGCCDMRGAPLKAQMDVLASASLAVGPSSGPMHMASLCKCPHLVWCGGGAAEVKYTSSRYATAWNPHKTPVRIIRVGSWRPSFDAVWQGLTKLMASLGI